jgi:hypothetical protein
MWKGRDAVMKKLLARYIGGTYQDRAISSTVASFDTNAAMELGD